MQVWWGFIKGHDYPFCLPMGSSLAWLLVAFLKAHSAVVAAAAAAWSSRAKERLSVIAASWEKPDINCECVCIINNLILLWDGITIITSDFPPEWILCWWHRKPISFWLSESQLELSLAIMHISRRKNFSHNKKATRWIFKPSAIPDLHSPWHSLSVCRSP